MKNSFIIPNANQTAKHQENNLENVLEEWKCTWRHERKFRTLVKINKINYNKIVTTIISVLNRSCVPFLLMWL